MHDLDLGQDARQLGEDIAVQVHQARVFRGEEHRDAQRLAYAGERGFIGGGERIAPVLAEVPCAAQAAGGGDTEGERQQDRDRSIKRARMVRPSWSQTAASANPAIPMATVTSTVASRNCPCSKRRKAAVGV